MDGPAGRPTVPNGGTGARLEALNAVYNLTNLFLPVDSHPNIHAAPTIVEYKADIDAGFADRNVYVAAMAKYLEEAAEQAKMREVMETGMCYASMLYTWRSCAMSLGQIKDVNNNAAEMRQKVLDVLQPEIQKLKDFMAFQKTAISLLEGEIKRLCNKKVEFVSEAHLLSLGKFISMLATLDELKNAKASIHNDFAYFKRVSDQLRRDPSTVAETHDVSMFLATHNVILSQVKTELSRISGFEEVMCNIISTCICWYEQKQYLLPQEKYNIVKMIGFLLYLVDSEKVNINKLKQLNLAKIDAIFKEVEVVPMFGDIVIGPFNFVRKTPNFDGQHWPRCLDGVASQQSVLVVRMREYRQQHVDTVCELTLLTEQHKRLIQNVKAKKKLEEDVLSPEQAATLYSFVVKCLRTLSTWTSHISEFFSWKLLHPAETPPNAEIYERATRYNYTVEEKSVLAELIGMVKSVQSLVLRFELMLSRGVHTYIFQQLQEFVSAGLAEPLRKADKHHKDVIKSIIVAVQNVIIDIDALAPPTASTTQAPPPVKKKPGKSVAAETTSSITLKAIRPSLTQLYLVRTMLESLVEKGDKASNRRTPRKDIDPAHVAVIEKFMQSSFLWSHLLDIHGSLEACCDLGQLWYREFYLEMTKGARIQFPIEMSMPWILMSHLLDINDPYFLQYILYPLDLYNDSAQCALRRFKKQFLYDEIDAEVNLCFEQFVYKLSEQIYEHYKSRAAQLMLDRSFRSECAKLKIQVSGFRHVNYACLMQQTNLQLMGRTVDLRHLISQHVNSCFVRSLDVAISRFESAGFTGLVELAGLLRVNRETHKLLGVHLQLDDFDSLLGEANSGVTAPYGRIALYVLLELSMHFLPHYCYNGSTRRFVKERPIAFAEEVKRDKPPATVHYNLWGTKELSTYYTAIYGRYHGFIGDPHFEAMVEVMGYQDIAMILKELIEIVKNLISSTLLRYLSALQDVMPKRCIMPRYEYTSPGVLGYFQAQLIDILAYTDLQPKVFQFFREVGNAIIFALHLEKQLSTNEANELIISAMFQHHIPVPFVPPKDGPDAKQQEAKQRQMLIDSMDKKYRNQHVVDIVSKKGSDEQVHVVREMSLLTREKLSTGLCMFGVWLSRLRLALGSDPLWTSLSTSGGAWNVETNTEFHRIWSAMQFVFCRPPGPNTYSVESLFGEGLNWAGCSLVVLLGQQRRYEAMDFSYHLLRIHKVDQLNKVCEGVDLRKMVDRIRKFQLLNDQVFAVVNKYLNTGATSGASRSAAHDYAVSIEHFAPPPTANRTSVAIGHSSSLTA